MFGTDKTIAKQGVFAATMNFEEDPGWRNPTGMNLLRQEATRMWLWQPSRRRGQKMCRRVAGVSVLA
jgi:hypothetical protein